MNNNFNKVNIIALGLTLGLIFGFIILIKLIFLYNKFLAIPSLPFGIILPLVSQFYKNNIISSTNKTVFTLTFLGFLDGFIGGIIIAFLYNFFISFQYNLMESFNKRKKKNVKKN